MTLFGREAYLPTSTTAWLALIGLLLIIAVLMARVSGWSTAALGVGAGLAGYLYDHRLFLPAAIAVAAGLAWLAGVRAGQAPAGWRALREGAILSAGFLAYEWGRTLFIGSYDEAVNNAERFLAFEARLGLQVEATLQRLLVRHDALMDRVNWLYSYSFIAFVLGVLFYLYVSDERLYRIYRTALGCSALLALITIALVPTAPPRLTEASGMFSTHEHAGLSHGFVNPYAAMPSLHVGWTVLAGFMLSRTTSGLARWLIAVVPGAAMLFTVMATGHHFWVDGAVGSIYGLVPAAILLRRQRAAIAPVMAAHRGPARTRLFSPVSFSAKARFSLVSLGSLLGYLVIRQQVDPGFTDHWGYMVGQLAATIVILIWLNDEFEPWGGLTWFTNLVVVGNAWADTLGTAGHMYSKYPFYDKITHFLGGVMLAAAAADIIFAVQRRRGLDIQPMRVFSWAICISVGLGAAWEVYEYYGDVMFNSGRWKGMADTRYDLIADSAGAIVSALVLWRWRAPTLLKGQPEPAMTVANPH